VSSHIGDWLGRRALLTPHKEGLVVMPSAQNLGTGSPGAEPMRFTFAEWNGRVNRLAHYLLSLGLQRGDRVAVLSQNCEEMLNLVFACGKVGAIYVPFNWRLTAAELNPLVQDSNPALFFYGPHFKPVVDNLQLPPTVALGGLDLGRFPETAPPPVPLRLDDPWMILYTAGTTGRSKGAVLSRRQVTWNAWNTIAGWGLSPEDRVPILTPLFHTGGLNVFTTPLVQLGGTSVLMGPYDPGQVLDAIEHEGLTIVFMVPTMFRMMMDHPGFSDADFSRVRFFISGGAPCPRPVYEAYWAKGSVFKSGYGMTEVGPNNFGLPDHEMKRKIGSVGFPLLHVSMRIMADDQPCGPGEVGELHLAGEHVCSGYWNNPAASQEANPDGWFRTGDLAYRDSEGFYYIVDRKKDMFISGGENVYPVEVEAAIYRHAAVAEAAVIGVPDPKWGEVGKAVVVCKPGTTVSAEDLLEHCRGLLARYKVPKLVEFRPELPKSAAGKILKRELRSQVSTKNTQQ